MSAFSSRPCWDQEDFYHSATNARLFPQVTEDCQTFLVQKACRCVVPLRVRHAPKSSLERVQATPNAAV